MGALGKRIDYFFSNWFIRNSRSKPVYPFRIRCDALVFCPNRNKRAKCFLERTTFWAEVDYQPSLYDSSPAAVLWCIEYSVWSCNSSFHCFFCQRDRSWDRGFCVHLYSDPSSSVYSTRMANVAFW